MNKQEIENLIEYVKDHSNNFLGSKATLQEKETFEYMYDLLIETLEKQLTNGWIPVSEQSPKHTGDYNVTVGVGSELGYFEEVRTYRYEIHNGKNPHKKWIIPNNFHETVNVIAWQPLPEPYKEDKDAERN